MATTQAIITKDLFGNLQTAVTVLERDHLPAVSDSGRRRVLESEINLMKMALGDARAAGIHDDAERNGDE